VAKVKPVFSASHQLAIVSPIMAEIIRFYRTGDAHGCFSNFAAFPIEIDGQKWPTSEHYFQAQKFADPERQEKIRTTPSPMIAARLGRDRKARLRSDWEAVKLDVMRAAVRAKFTQHKDIREILLSTGNAEIIEHTTNDRYWGDGGDGHGQNWLGRILMEIREELRAAKG
jgi:N-glycosidase YbiA